MNEILDNKRVGIITYNRAHNCGSALQAFALQLLLKNEGYDVKIIDFVQKTDYEQYRIFRTHTYKKRIMALCSDIVFVYRNAKRLINYRKFWKEYFDLTDATYYSCKEMASLNEEFDIFICGSDQIWNFDGTDGPEPAFFLQFASDEKLKIAYAPSMGQVKFKKDWSNILKKYVNTLDYISVREESSVPFLKSVTSKPVSTELDPTLLLDVKQYQNMLENQFHKRKILKTDKYIFMYAREVKDELIQYCQKLEKDTGFRLYYFHENKLVHIKKGKNVYGISPIQFLEYIQSASYIVTDSFHATVFSILFSKPFCVFKTSVSSCRVTDLLKKLNLEDRVYNEQFDWSKQIDYGKVNDSLVHLRELSVAHLLQAIQQGK